MQIRRAGRLGERKKERKKKKANERRTLREFFYFKIVQYIIF
jgi:hypothetical protein